MSGTGEAARRVGVCKNTLLRWIDEGYIPDVGRDWRGWRVWSGSDIARAQAFRESYHAQGSRPAPDAATLRLDGAKSIDESMSRLGSAWEKGGKPSR